MTWAHLLVQWFGENQRVMPWRSDPQPYYVWVSEVMLQQTQVDTVIPYFQRFLTRFPTLKSLADADQQEVLKAWEGLGYYSRARNFHKAAKHVVEKLNGVIPGTYEELQTLPGIGPYCGAAICSIAFGEPVPVVDGNVLRVFARFWGITDDIRLPKVRIAMFDRLMPVIAEHPPSMFNQAMMELGALICKSSQPLCQKCPLNTNCYAYLNNETKTLPYKSSKPAVPHYEIAVGVIWQNDKLLIARRKEDQMLGGLWEFPGGKRREDETFSEAVFREVLEETGLTVAVGELFATVRHAYTHFKITMYAYHCQVISGEAAANCSDEIQWISPSELEKYPFPKANKHVIDQLLNGALCQQLLELR